MRGSWSTICGRRPSAVRVKTAIKFITGATAILLALWGLDSLSDALFVPYTTLRRALIGLGCLAGALAIVAWLFVDTSRKEY
jgi:hypothetical protein